MKHVSEILTIPILVEQEMRGNSPSSINLALDYSSSSLRNFDSQRSGSSTKCLGVLGEVGTTTTRKRRSYSHPLQHAVNLSGSHATHQESLVLFPRHNTDDPNAGRRIFFPECLYRMMKDLDQQQAAHLSDIVSWHHSDLAFVIHKPDDFVSKVMPIYFRGQTKLSSFQRQLQNYSFQRYQERGNKSSLIYDHEHFRRHKPFLLQQFALKSSKKTAKNTTLSIASLLQMQKKSTQVIASTAMSYRYPRETAQICFRTLDTTNLPLPMDNLGDQILDEAAAELQQWRPKEVCGADFCPGDNFDCQQQQDGLYRLAVQEWDTEVELLHECRVDSKQSATFNDSCICTSTNGALLPIISTFRTGVQFANCIE